MKTEVINIVTRNAYDIYIGRGSKWGNPFIIGKDGTREIVIQKYENWIRNQPELMTSLEELRGKKLGCFCKPKMCHGDIIIKILNEITINQTFE